VLLSRMYVRLTVLVVVVVAALAAAPSSQAKPPRDFVGITADDIFGAGVHGNTAYQDSNLGSIAATRTGLLRKVFSWKEIETSPGHYNFTAYDRLVLRAAAHGIKVLPIIFDPPSFRAKGHGGHGTWPPAHNADMAAFAQVLARRYGRHGTLWSSNPSVPRKAVTSWQIWNEPSLTVYWLPHPSARQYARMLKVVGRAIERVDGRRTEIVTAGIPPSLLSSAVRITRYIRGLYRAHGKRYFDTLAINSYARNAGELKRLLGQIRRLMNRNHDRRAKIWITELGWATSGPHNRFNVGESGQAHRISSAFRTIRKLRRRYRLRGVVYFSWKDQPPYAPLFQNLWGLHTGLVRQSGTFKPSYNTYKRAVRRLRR
jgi:polysaccharide biosynthesis protein PslG